MPTIIDSLIVTLGLDSKEFKSSQDQVVKALGQIRDLAGKTQASLKSTGEGARVTATQMQAQGKIAGEFFSNIKNEALGLVTVLLGGRGIAALIQDSVTSVAAMGRAAHNMGVEVPQLAAFRSAIEANGGSAEAAAGSMQGLADAMAQMAATGGNPQLRGALAQIGALGQRNPIEVVRQYSRYVQGHPGNVGFNRVLGHALGLDEGTINSAMRGSIQLEKDLAEARRHGAPTPEMIGHLTDLQRAFNGARQSASYLVDLIVDAWAPALTNLFDAISGFIDHNRGLASIITQIVTALIAFRVAMLALRAVLFVSGLTSLVSGLTALGAVPGLVAIGPSLLSIAIALARLAGPIAAFLAIMWPSGTQTQDQENKALGRPEGTGAFGAPPRPAGTEPTETNAHRKFREFFGIAAPQPSDQDAQAFYNRIYGVAKAEATARGLPNPEVMARLAAAQATVESAHGTSDLARRSNNLFGIKPGTPGGVGESGRSGDYVAFRSQADAVKGYFDFVTKNPRQAGILQAQSVEDATRRIGSAGYAEDPGYQRALNATNARYGAARSSAPATQPPVATRPTQPIQIILPSQPTQTQAPINLNQFGASQAVRAGQIAAQPISARQAGAGDQHVNVTGPITINTQATDARGIARSLRAELGGKRLAAMAGTGLA